MEYLTTKDIKIEEKTIVTIGSFDGIHLGHKELIDEVLLIKNENPDKNLKSVILSFSPHPMSLILGTPFSTLFTKEERKHIVESIGVDVFIEYPFDKEVMELSPEEFVQDIIIDKLNASYVVIGEDYSFGNNKEGDHKLLKLLVKDKNIEVIVIPLKQISNEKIGSSGIKKLLEQSNMEKVKHLLDKPYFIIGEVVHGKELGRTIGFPTMNILPKPTKLLPPNGVYISTVYVDGQIYDAITNIGVNPTVNGKNLVCESHILDFSQDIYGKIAKVELLKKVRDEKKFNSLDELKNQINDDVNALRKYKNEL